MLIQSALPDSFKTSFSCACKNSTCDCALAENCKGCCSCEQGSGSHCQKLLPLMDVVSNKGSEHLSSSLAKSQLSSVGTMEKSLALVVYKRRKANTISVSDSSAQNAARLSDLSNISSENPSRVAEEAQVASEDPGCVNDTYSSSKLVGELGSNFLRTEVEETGDCSSSSALVVVGSQDCLSERDMCIAIIKNHWLAKGLWPSKGQRSTRPPDTTMSSSSLRPCNVCQIKNRSVEMLICDECDEAFHFSCCHPCVRKMPVSEWFCYSCVKKKDKTLKKLGANKMRKNQSGARRSEDKVSAVDLSIARKVRIGPQFQADIPDCSGPSLEDVGAVGEPMEIDYTDRQSLHNGNNLRGKFSAVSNWVQCRQVIEGTGGDSDGAICGKWRRAPIFEVQTDDWECFRCILWDSAYADCAVPQELNTEEILKQRKSAEMARASLRVKKRRSGQAKNAGPRGDSDDLKKIQT